MIVRFIFKHLYWCEACLRVVEDLLEVNLKVHFIALQHAHIDALNLHLQFKSRELPYKSAVDRVLNVLNLLVTLQLGVE